MKKHLSVNEFDLLDFFEAEPGQLDTNVPWIYNDSAYETSDGSIQISLAIAPAVKDVRVILRCNGVSLYELNALAVNDIRIRDDKGRKSLEIVLSAGNSVCITLKPRISISQQSLDKESSQDTP